MIGKNIQTYRKQMNMTQEALAELARVARQTIVKWESGESTPDLETAGRIADVLRISLDDLVNTQEGEVESDRSMKGKHLFGLVTVGDKGQIVIPARARKVFNLQPGDQLMVLGDENQGLALVNAQLFIRAAEEMKNGR
ncbi:MAG: helix-turn-helix domain-containing protein [Clostridiales bacterium]|nr:helix-turn-helix domain-containing protein [Clostridiales bacterium]